VSRKFAVAERFLLATARIENLLHLPTLCFGQVEPSEHHHRVVRPHRSAGAPASASHGPAGPAVSSTLAAGALAPLSRSQRRSRQRQRDGHNRADAEYHARNRSVHAFLPNRVASSGPTF
jgi:hypothetical protein